MGDIRTMLPYSYHDENWGESMPSNLSKVREEMSYLACLRLIVASVNQLWQYVNSIIWTVTWGDREKGLFGRKMLSIFEDMSHYKGYLFGVHSSVQALGISAKIPLNEPLGAKGLPLVGEEVRKDNIGKVGSWWISTFIPNNRVRLAYLMSRIN